MEDINSQNQLTKDNLLQVKQIFESLNKETVQQLAEYDWKQDGVQNLPQFFERLHQNHEVKLKEKIEDPSQFQLALDKIKSLEGTMACVYQSLHKFLIRCAKRLLKIYTNESYKQVNPPTQLILKQLTQYKGLLIYLKNFFEYVIFYYQKSFKHIYQNQFPYIEQQVISSRFSIELENELKKQILYELQIFLYAIVQSPSAYVYFFNEKLDKYLENIDILEETIDLSKCQRYIFKIIVEELSSKWPNAQNFINLVKPQFMDFLLFMNMKMAAVFNQHINMVLAEIEIFKKITEKVRMTNKYILIGLLKELQKKLYEILQNNLMETTFFSNINPDIVKQFATFIIEKHEMYTMHQGNMKKSSEIDCDSDREDPVKQQIKKTKSSQQVSDEIEKKLQMVASKKEEISIQKIFKEDGHTGFLIETEKGRQYVIHKNEMDEVVIVNTKFIQGNWKLQVPNEDEKDKDETSAKRERLEAVMKNNPLSGYLQSSGGGPPPDMTNNTVFVNSTMGNVGASLGYCLANINKYKSTGEFMQDFGFNATVNGTITLLAQRIPIIGTLLLIGGLGWTSLKLYSEFILNKINELFNKINSLYENKTANNKSKINKAGKIALSTGTSIGGSIGGAILGQAIIPVPILGALVGGFIGNKKIKLLILGGLIGGTSTSLIIGALNKKKYVEMIKSLEVSMSDQGYWEYSRSNLNIYGITNKFFRNTMPKNLINRYEDTCGNIWLTMNTYCLITLYYAAKDERKKIKREKILKEKEEKEKHEQEKQEKALKKKLEKEKKKMKDKDYVDDKESSDMQEYENKDIIQTINEEQKMEFKDEDEEDLNDDIEWPFTITQPQHWLMSNQYYIQENLKEVESFVKKVMADT